jgi:hypothetical protein
MLLAPVAHYNKAGWTSSPTSGSSRVGRMSNDASDHDDKLDQTLEQTFPASDPPASPVQTGVGIRRVTSLRSRANDSGQLGRDVPGEQPESRTIEHRADYRQQSGQRNGVSS